jgi:hypothetical protein
MAIVSSGVAVLMFFLFPETQFTKHETVMSSKRTWVDEFRFWPVSGGGAPKVHRYVTGLVYSNRCHTDGILQRQSCISRHLTLFLPPNDVDHYDFLRIVSLCI